MRILFASLLGHDGASGRQRLAALRTLGHDVRVLDLSPYDRRGPVERRVRERILRIVPFRRADERALGSALAAAVRVTRPDLVWVEKAPLLRRSHLAEARQAHPRAVFVCFQDDDPFGPRTGEHVGWSNFVDAIASYDAHFVKRQATADEFLEAGARRALLFMHGVHAPLFHPGVEVNRERDVVFVGTPYDHRVAAVTALIRQQSLPLQVFGDGWFRSPCWLTHRHHFHEAVVEQRYADVLRSARIALGFVSSSNRDEYSMRTFEIPACGAMLLAERTNAHRELFREGVEAEFFEDVEECAEKIGYYLNHEDERERIARAGHSLVSRPEHALSARMKHALEQIAAAARERAHVC